MNACNICYDKQYYLVTYEEEWEWVRCDCFHNKEKEGKNV